MRKHFVGLGFICHRLKIDPKTILGSPLKCEQLMLRHRDILAEYDIVYPKPEPEPEPEPEITKVSFGDGFILRWEKQSRKSTVPRPSLATVHLEPVLGGWRVMEWPQVGRNVSYGICGTLEDATRVAEAILTPDIQWSEQETPVYALA